MPSFERLTIAEARTLTRAELLPRIEAEQKYWYDRIHACAMKPGDEQAFKTFNDIVHIAANPRRAISDTDAIAEGRPFDRDYWTKPLGELGEL
ncbi:hypothetical protein [Nonomuraea gerenzanensis]|uniref:Uncharacterized protein n=1 Tax=Nonomuraea gerenzanensis TaxID=93944 RepID=A0A1M4DZG1_9ACTN|nr:hypothetical protein [Nonomuraea gerenzanensis]UBU14238.1 hypothetical protein LCN96_04190 [Nonomuraea gerenzanensis]SBO91934.1 hypothetical protein BN4615_P1448 [Nonomuraea gerenzanensis]